MKESYLCVGVGNVQILDLWTTMIPIRYTDMSQTMIKERFVIHTPLFVFILGYYTADNSGIEMVA